MVRQETSDEDYRFSRTQRIVLFEGCGGSTMRGKGHPSHRTQSVEESEARRRRRQEA